jgi:hypothetical protein
MSAGATPHPFAAVSSSVSAPVRGRVLDLAYIDDERLVLLMEDEVGLYRRRGDAVVRVDHRPLDVSTAVRAPAGLLVATAGEAAFWATTNRHEGAVLFTIDGERLHEIERASALPWPGVPHGARFRPGTNLIDASVPGLGDGPHLRAGAGAKAWAIAPDGRLGAGGEWSETRVGSAAAELGNGWIASGPKPPGAADTLLVLRAAEGAPIVAAAIPVPGSITAIGARARGDRALVAAGVVDDGTHRLVLMELARDGP